ncbi:hypothetical protein C8J56DRAFT_858778 [Mycena floridula]|nr:hypothetical protein C8J56DRAFT_858778 [Mycena floridula]
MDVLVATAEATAALHSFTTRQLIQRTIDANRAHEYTSTIYAQRLTQELADIDKLLDAASVPEPDDLPEADIVIEGSKKLTSVLSPPEILGPDSPFYEDSSARQRYTESMTTYYLKPKEVKRLTEAVKDEHRRLRAIEAQTLRLPMPDASEEVDFDKNIDQLNWKLIAEKVNDITSSKRTADDCRVKWLGELHPKINREEWEDEELAKLQSIVDNIEGDKIDWVKVAKELGTNRMPVECMRRAMTRKYYVWDEAGENKLREGIALYGIDNWNLVARHVSEDTTGHQCILRHARINPKLKRGNWTPEEDERLASAVAGYGSSWPDVAAAMPGRTSDMCRDRWSETKTASASMTGFTKWTVEEDKTLIDAVAKHGNAWTKISLQFGDKFSDKQCRQHYTKLKKRLDEADPLPEPDPDTVNHLFARSDAYLGTSPVTKPKPVVRPSKKMPKSRPSIPPATKPKRSEPPSEKIPARPEVKAKRARKSHQKSEESASSSDPDQAGPSTAPVSKPRPKPRLARSKPKPAVSSDVEEEERNSTPVSESDVPTPKRRKSAPITNPSITEPTRRSSRLSTRPRRNLAEDSLAAVDEAEE